MPGRAVCRTYGALEKGARHPSRLRATGYTLITSCHALLCQRGTREA